MACTIVLSPLRRCTARLFLFSRRRDACALRGTQNLVTQLQHTPCFCASSVKCRNPLWNAVTKANLVELYTVSSLSRDDDTVREIDYIPYQAMLVNFGESVKNRGEVCPNTRRCLFWLNVERTDHLSGTDGPCCVHSGN
jgi:hypothetical protein